MKAAILETLSAPLVVADIEPPASLAFGQVRVRVRYSGICGSQLNEIDGVKGPDRFLPHLLGHEGSAIVEEVGEGVATVKPGDHVVMHWRKGDGLQSPTPVYRWNGRTVNAGWVTTFNERAVVSENRLTSIPADFDPRTATLFGCALTTAFALVSNDACLKIGRSVVILGAGGVGLSLVIACGLVSANPIVVVDRVPEKLEMARRLGATHTLSIADRAAAESAVRDCVGARGADAAIDTTGDGRMIEFAYELTHPDGRTVMLGVPRKEDKIRIYSLPLHFEKVLTGSHGGGAQPHLDIPAYIRLHQARPLPLDPLITHEFGLDDINEAIALVRTGKAGRVLIAME